LKQHLEQQLGFALVGERAAAQTPRRHRGAQRDSCLLVVKAENNALLIAVVMPFGRIWLTGLEKLGLVRVLS